RARSTAWRAPRRSARCGSRCPTASASAAPTPASSSAPSDPRKPPRPARRRRALFSLLIAVLAVGAVAAGGWFYALHVLAAPGPLPEARALVVPRGGEARVALALADALVVARPLPFRVAAFLTRREGALHAGEFAFPAHASLRTVLTVLRTARPVQHYLTSPEARTGTQIAALMERGDGRAGPTPAPYEGSVPPQTYAYQLGASRETVLDRARTAMD